MTHDHFTLLLETTASQPEPQRLLFVFAATELPDNPTAEQQARFAEGRGGALTPLMCVDKAPAELAGFDALRSESDRAGPPWDVVFAAALSGADGKPPAKGRVDGALEMMVDAVRMGGVGRFAAYGRTGEPLLFE